MSTQLDSPILAYGSLVDDPGQEIQALIARRLHGLETPFRVEFARSSGVRGSAYIKAGILVLEEYVSEAEAKDMLWRRETGKVGTYDLLANLGPDKVYVE